MRIGPSMQRPRWRGRLGRGLSAGVVALSVIAAAACSSSDSGAGVDDPASQGMEGATGGSEATSDEQSGDNGLVPQPPVDVAASLSRFAPPGEASKLPPADPAHCPGADPQHVLNVFPEATEYQAASFDEQPPHAADGEMYVQCRLSYEVTLLDDECTLMEVRDVAFSPEATSTVDTHDGTLVTGSRSTYFTGMAQKPGVTLDYSLTVGCDETTDLSDLETQFRAVWIGHRDQFITTPTYERP